MRAKEPREAAQSGIEQWGWGGEETLTSSCLSSPQFPKIHRDVSEKNHISKRTVVSSLQGEIE